MFRDYGNHAAQYLADSGGVAGEGASPNNLHFNTLSLQSSINITKLVENTTRLHSYLLRPFVSRKGREGFKEFRSQMRCSLLGKNPGWGLSQALKNLCALCVKRNILT